MNRLIVQGDDWEYTPEGVSEIMMHPVYSDKKIFGAADLLLLTDEDIILAVSKSTELITYGGIR